MNAWVIDVLSFWLIACWREVTGRWILALVHNVKAASVYNGEVVSVYDAKLVSVYSEKVVSLYTVKAVSGSSVKIFSGIATQIEGMNCLKCYTLLAALTRCNPDITQKKVSNVTTYDVILNVSKGNESFT